MVFLRTHQPYSGTEVLMETKLERIAEISANSPRPEFTSLYHLINKEMLLQCHKELDGNKAVGVDEITKKEYERNLEQNIDDLVERLKRKSYKPQPSIRVYIPKSNGKLRPLGIACYEDKIVQLALKKILEAIYEPRFLNCMYGFRPNRGCHNAIKELYKRLNNTKICYIVDADIKGFFDHMKHEWIIKFLKLYIKDPNIIGLVKKYLKVGVLDNGELMVNEEGSAQGNIISPILANIYMHNVLTLWYKFIITKECKGDNFLIVYADDFVAGFQYKWEAENYYKLLKERMEKFGLQLEDSKSRLLQSGAYIARAKQKSGECIRLQTFDFLGFTFYCGRSRKGIEWLDMQYEQEVAWQKSCARIAARGQVFQGNIPEAPTKEIEELEDSFYQAKDAYIKLYQESKQTGKFLVLQNYMFGSSRMYEMLNKLGNLQERVE